MKDNSKLLPEGFCDLIDEEARVNQDSSYKLIDFFQDFGYDLVKTPLLELEKTLNDYQKSNQKSFQIFDIILVRIWYLEVILQRKFLV